MKLKSFQGLSSKINWLQIPWTIIKVSIYLLVAYSVIFTIGVSIGAYKVYDYVDQQLESVRKYKTVNPHETEFMKLAVKKLDPKDLPLLQKTVPLSFISPHLQNAVIAVEDAAFFQHPGIHLESILAAMETNKLRGKKTHGGSTLTQQLAKNLFLSPEKSMQRKVKEAIYTLLMEKYLGKERILELYLNYAQWGKNIFGCEAAAQHYFKKSCKEINFYQSVQLASTLANPVKYTPYSRGSVLLSQRKRIIYENLYATRKISLETFMEITGDQPRMIKEKAYRESLTKLDTDTNIEEKKDSSE